jgi:signal peptidase
MEPAFQRGDILFLNNQDDPIRVGEIVVFKIKDRDIPIVHRVMKVHEKADGKVIFKTLNICSGSLFNIYETRS